MNTVKSLVLVNKNFPMVNPLDCGEQKCAPDYSFGPAVRKYVLIHYVISGCGTITDSETTYSVSAGEAFIIKPGEITTYKADNTNPWHYVWIGFDGSLSEKFCNLPRVISPDGKIFKEMSDAYGFSGTAEEFLAGKIFELYASLFSGKNESQNYIRKIENFIETNYSEKCDVIDISKALGLERHYLARIFKQKTGKTLKMYIVEKRMEEAKKLLLSGNSVSSAAFMCGYRDAFVFSKMFKKLYGVSPANWKNMQ